MGIIWIWVAQDNRDVDVDIDIDTDLFTEQLRILWIDVEALLEQETISRYEVARLLNAVECNDCIVPSQQTIGTYTAAFRAAFRAKPDEDFRDVQYGKAVYNGKSYYYCVAYAGDNEYMNGFPLETSPVCAGDFCGEKEMSKGEFYQLIVNMIEVYTYSQFSTNRQTIQTRLQAQPSGSYQWRTFNLTDRGYIEQWVVKCGDSSCSFEDRFEFRAYLKYCMFNLEACGMQPFDFIVDGWRPVAQINTLLGQWILTFDEIIPAEIYNPASGEEVVRTLARLQDVVGCTLNEDYDCDSITNTLDICPNQYNPQQRDLDNDGIGNVCDDDIDGDGSMNPIGVVDERDNVVIENATPDMDNCLFIVNSDQQDTNQNKKGDACEQQTWIGVRLDIQERESETLTIESEAIIEGSWTSIRRDMGDGTIINGSQQRITHTYQEWGIYTIIATIQSPAGTALAKATAMFDQDQTLYQWMQIQAVSFWWPAPQSMNFSVTHRGDLDTIQRLVDGIVQKELSTTQSFNHIFSQPWYHTISAQWYRNNELIAVAETNALINESLSNPIAHMNADRLIVSLGQPVILRTIINCTNPLVEKIDREFGDGTTFTSQSLTVQKRFAVPWRKVVIQYVHFSDGTIIKNFLTLHVRARPWAGNAFTTLQPSRLIQETNQPNNLTLNQESTINPTNSTAIRNTHNGTTHTQPLINQTTSYAYTYPTPWVYSPTVRTYDESCTQLNAQATLTVQWPSLCEELYRNGQLDQFVCDADNDNIPDVCDSDIDNDWVRNLLGILTDENDDCTITTDLINADLLNEHFTNTCSIDNCPFDSNRNQSDTNADGRGDVCGFAWWVVAWTADWWNNSDDRIDTDNDGIADNDDACITIPENYNGVQDGDGCPEIAENDPCFVANGLTESTGESTIEEIYEDYTCGLVTLPLNESIADPVQTNIPEEPIILPENCNQCPCHFADFEWNIIPGDQVRARLLDLQGEKSYNISLPEQVP